MPTDPDAGSRPRPAREEHRGRGAGPRGHPGGRCRQPGRPEEPDPWRTCFERDRDRILHATAFRRLAGKTQVFVFPDDHQRTRLTHALEVAQVATGIARACRLNVALTEAIALGHDCGHGPGGPRQRGRPLPLSRRRVRPRALGGRRLAGPAQPVRRDARRHPQPLVVPAGTVHARGRGGELGGPHRLRLPRLRGRGAGAGSSPRRRFPALVRERCGDRRSQQLGTFIDALVSTILATGRIGMADEQAEALAAFRASNYEHIYLRPSSVAQGRSVVVGPAGPGRLLRGPAQPDPRRRRGPNADLDRRRARRRPRRGGLRGRDDRPVRLQPGRRPAGLGSRTSCRPGSGSPTGSDSASR